MKQSPKPDQARSRGPQWLSMRASSKGNTHQPDLGWRQEISLRVLAFLTLVAAKAVKTNSDASEMVVVNRNILDYMGSIAWCCQGAMALIVEAANKSLAVFFISMQHSTSENKNEPIWALKGLRQSEMVVLCDINGFLVEILFESSFADKNQCNSALTEESSTIGDEWPDIFPRNPAQSGFLRWYTKALT